VSTIVRGSNYVEYDELPVPVQRKLNEFLSPVQRKLDEDCVPVQYEEESRCKSEPDSTSASEPECISNSTSASSSVGGSQTSSSQVPVSYEAALCCLPVQFTASNISRYKAEPESEGELPSSTYANQVLLNQGQKVANLSDRGNSLPCNSELPTSALTLFDGNASWQKSGTSTEEAPLGKLLLGSPTEEAPQAKLLPPIRGMCARVQYKTLYKVTMFVEGRKWLPLGFPLRRSCSCICLVVESLPRFKTNGIWARRRREPSDQVSADRMVHPDRWLEDALASYHEAGDLMDVVWQPRILIILFIRWQ